VDSLNIFPGKRYRFPFLYEGKSFPQNVLEGVFHRLLGVD
jgi:hypothetical protein